METVQGVVQTTTTTTTTPPSPSAHMVHWASRLRPESIVHVKGTEDTEDTEEVRSTSVHNAEIRVIELHVISRVEERVPFTVYDADLNKDDKEAKLASLTPYITDRARLGSRIIHLRSASAQAVFRIQSTMSLTFRSNCYEGKNVVRTLTRIPPFLEIHTPKLQGGASESGASVFKLKYFGRLAFLAQSPQLFKQMAIAADFGGVFEVGPVFRAENSNTKRHLTEYTGLDLEMGIQREYHEVMLVVDSVLKAIFREVYGKRRREVEVVKRQFGVGEDLVWKEKTVVMAFADGIQMLIDDGWVDDSGKPPRKDEDLSTRAEIRLGELVKEKYKTDYYILDLFPKSARPFYTMPASPSTQSHLSALHPNSPAPGGPCGPLTHSFDIFVRGQEITTGGQRIHTYPALLDSMAAHDISARGLEEYLDGFKWGAPPHGGAGIGLERLVMLVLGLGDVRYGSMYPRDPRSLPEPPRGLEGVRHVEASTMGVSRLSQQRLAPPASSLPPIPSLIANYGDAANTSWLDDRYLVWRDVVSGGAIGFVPSSSGYAIVVGDPLCDESQYVGIVHPRTNDSVLSGLSTNSTLDPSSESTITPGPTSPSTQNQNLTYPSPLPPLKPIWLLASSHLERILGSRLSWSSFTCIAESRVELEGEVPGALEDKEVARKVRKAESEGVSVGAEESKAIALSLKHAIDERIEEWKEGRKTKGGQVRLTDVEVWRDYIHRVYFVALAPKTKNTTSATEEEEDNIPVSLVVLHQLSPLHGFQVKYALDFPSSSSGSIELTLSSAMHFVASTGSGRLTFGTSATSRLTPTRGLRGMRIKVLSHAYEAISDRMALRGKGEFRKKMGAEEEDVFICFPRGGMGARGAKAVLDFCVAES
ncbi:putative aspartate-tRNA ligase [Lentinula raphanica]|uniref:aspartate--tRNA ligase n=1 Tax=Lentinula raphanica TaxID=153919 RepID=A0AA38P7U7_9AGAR|nr:putative aspartate-tRNA ligase [Lentinula raphanica]